MLSFVCFFALVAGTVAAPITCPQKNITVTTSWQQLATPVNSNCPNFYSFSFPSDSYANIKIRATDASAGYTVQIYDNFGTQFDLSPGSSGIDVSKERSASINFRSTFNVLVNASPENSLKVEITVTVNKLNQPTSVTPVTTKGNDQPTVVYLKDWTVGTSYTFTSKSKTSKISIMVDPHFVENTVDEHSRLSNVFVTDGNVNMGTIYPFSKHQYVSNTNQVTLYLAESTNLMGAIVVTDYENVKAFLNYVVQYVPVGTDFSTSYAPLVGGWNGGSGAVTIVGEKNGATPITVRQLNDSNEGGKFSYVSGGPVADFHVVSSPLTNSQLPKTLGGSLNTFVISKGTGSVKYSI